MPLGRFALIETSTQKHQYKKYSKNDNDTRQKYIGDGGNEKRVLIKDAKIGWEVVVVNPNRHLANGVTQYDYAKTLRMKLGDQARLVLDNFSDKWGHTRRPW